MSLYCGAPHIHSCLAVQSCTEHTACIQFNGNCIDTNVAIPLFEFCNAETLCVPIYHIYIWVNAAAFLSCPVPLSCLFWLLKTRSFVNVFGHLIHALGTEPSVTSPAVPLVNVSALPRTSAARCEYIEFVMCVSMEISIGASLYCTYLRQT